MLEGMLVLSKQLRRQNKFDGYGEREREKRKCRVIFAYHRNVTGAVMETFMELCYVNLSYGVICILVIVQRQMVFPDNTFTDVPCCSQMSLKCDLLICILH